MRKLLMIIALLAGSAQAQELSRSEIEAMCTEVDFSPQPKICAQVRNGRYCPEIDFSPMDPACTGQPRSLAFGCDDVDFSPRPPKCNRQQEDIGNK